MRVVGLGKVGNVGCLGSNRELGRKEGGVYNFVEQVLDYSRTKQVK